MSTSRTFGGFYQHREYFMSSIVTINKQASNKQPQHPRPMSNIKDETTVQRPRRTRRSAVVDEEDEAREAQQEQEKQEEHEEEQEQEQEEQQEEEPEQEVEAPEPAQPITGVLTRSRRQGLREEAAAQQLALSTRTGGGDRVNNSNSAWLNLFYDTVAQEQDGEDAHQEQDGEDDESNEPEQRQQEEEKRQQGAKRQQQQDPDRRRALALASPTYNYWRGRQGFANASAQLEAIAQPLALVAAAVEQVARNQPGALHQHLGRRRAGTALLESIAARYGGGAGGAGAGTGEGGAGTSSQK
ncbi:MAG: hypothetical protein IPK82_23150 [Polyangiaceae bacterium]|nr:hypothetical protein [Polyangiaceae bacterium]